MNPLTTYILAFMLARAPVESHRFTGATDAQTTARYAGIAADIADVSMDPEEPPVFSGDDGRVKTAMLLASITLFESGGYRADVDELRHRGDGGQAVCLAQIHPWKGERIVDRPSCLRAALRHLRSSFASCHSMSGYTVGRCEEHEPKAELRIRTAIRWLDHHPFAGSLPSP